MSIMRGAGDGSDSPQGFVDPSQTLRGQEALTALGRESMSVVGPFFLHVHKDTSDLRYIAERYRRRRSKSFENTVEFELDPVSGQILVKIKDEVTGEVQLRLSPEEVERVLKGLEETEESESTLAGFFIDVKL